MRLIPYGISYFPTVRNENYVYVDKTKTLADLESTGSRYVFLLRPRRFGKSLMCSLMEHYYDIRHAAHFDKWFAGTWIGQNPTPTKNSYVTLTLSFASVDVDSDLKKTENSFNINVLRALEKNLDHATMEGLIEGYDKEFLAGSPGRALSDFVTLFWKHKIKVLLIIDEYDNFANNILLVHGEEVYKNVTHGTGFFRSFWAHLKDLTQQGTLDRLFVTGVSPLVLADVTSGFNIGADFSTNPLFATCTGFTEAEVLALLVEQTQGTPHKPDNVLNLLRDWYNGYKLSDKPCESVYNSDMVLYFLREFQTSKSFPRDMIDTNIRTDYSKLRHLLLLSRKLNGNFNILRELLDSGEIAGTFVRSFAIGDKIDGSRFKSFLYFMGLTTFADTSGSAAIWRVPNKVIAHMMWEYIREALTDVYGKVVDTGVLESHFLAMSMKGNWKSAFEYLFEQFYKVASNRDFVFHELGVKMFLLAYLQFSEQWITHSEHELSQGFSDIYLKANHRFPELKRSYIVELKYIPQGGGMTVAKLKKQVADKVTEAQVQLKRYKPLVREIGGNQTTKIIAVVGSKGLLYLSEAS